MLPSAARPKQTKQCDQLNKLLVSYWLVTGCLMSLNGHFGHKDQVTGAQQEWRTAHQEGQQGRLYSLAGLAGGLGSSESPVPLPCALLQITHHKTSHTHNHRDMIPPTVKTTRDNYRYAEQG